MFLFFLRSLEIYLYGQSSDTLRDRLLRMVKNYIHTYNVSNQIFEDYKKLENYIKNSL